MLRMLDLFAGIGGFSLAARWTGGIETALFCEIDPFCRRVLAKNFPGVPIHDDIRTLTGRDVARSGAVDLVTGGFPCQPYSVAGQRRGQKDDRHLWPEMARLVDEVRPRWVLGENVPGIIPLALDDCLADLERIGYEAWPVVVPACAVGAPHRRDRVWVVAHAERGAGESADGHPPLGGRADDAEQAGLGGGRSETAVADADAGRQLQPAGVVAEERRRPADGGRQQAERGLGRVADGLPSGLDRPERAWGAGWEDGVSRTTAREPERAARLKALGNAAVPQVAYEFLRLIVEIEAKEATA